MKYNSLFLIAGILIVFSLGFWIDIKPKLTELNTWQSRHILLHKEISQELNLINEEKNIKKSLNDINQYPFPYRHENNSIVGTELLTEILLAGELSGLHIESINPLSWKIQQGVNILEFQVWIDASFIQFIEFISLLDKYSLPIILGNFYFEAKSNEKLQIKLKLIGGYLAAQQSELCIKNQKRKAHFIPFKITHNPFSSSATVNDISTFSNYRENSQDLLRSIPFRYFKWVGSIQQGQRTWVLGMLPNHKMVKVSKDSIVGIEGARILFVNEKKMLLELQGQRFVKNFFELN